MNNLPEPLREDEAGLRSMHSLSRREAIAHILAHLEDADTEHVVAIFNAACTLQVEFNGVYGDFRFKTTRKTRTEYRASIAHPSQVVKVSARLKENGFTLIAFAEPEGTLARSLDNDYLPDEDKPVVLISTREVVPELPDSAIQDLLS